MTDRPRRICFVGLDNYPILNPSWGNEYFGGESVQQTLLARAFRDRGDDVSTVVMDLGNPDGETLEGIKVWNSYRRDAGIPGLRFFHPKVTSLFRALSRANADVYYQSCAGMLTGIVGAFCSHNKRRNVFRVAHDNDCIPGQYLIRLWRDKKLYEYGLRKADLIAAQTAKQQTLLSQNLGLSSHIVNMVVEEPRESLEQPRDIDILWVNNMRPFKRPELVLELAEHIPQHKIVMIGGGVPGLQDYYRSIEQGAARLANLDFLGAVPYSEVNSYFARSRLFVNTSESEGFPNSYLQAWVRKVPVIAFFDPDGVIDRHNLGHVASSVEDMANRISGLLSETEQLAVLAETARNYTVANYSADTVAGRYAELMTTWEERSDHDA